MKKKRKDFEIKFYEELLQKTPNFVQALSCLGDAYTRKGFYNQGLEVDKKLSLLRPQDPVVYYNLACSLSLVGDYLSAYKELKRAVLLGYDDFHYILKDPDLKELRRDNRFESFFSKIKKLEKNKLFINI